VHAVDHALADAFHFFAAALVAHRLAQKIRLARREVGRDDRDLHPLFLEERNAERALEHGLEHRVRIGDGLFAVLAAQVWMDHLALDRARANECDFHHEIVKTARLEAGQGVHLRAALHLEHADRIRSAEVVVHGLILEVELAKVDRHAARSADVLEAVLHGGEHAEPEQVDLHEPDGVEVVLLPLNDGAFVHGGGLDRDDRGERLFGEHESADVNSPVSGRLVQALDDVG
jgi:hypothetical protein